MAEFMNRSDTCIVCFGCKLDGKLIRHHVCYFPEKIAYVHFECHRKIHDTPLPIFIQYNDGDSRKFYEMPENKNEGGSSIKSRLLSQWKTVH